MVVDPKFQQIRSLRRFISEKRRPPLKPWDCLARMLMERCQKPWKTIENNGQWWSCCCCFSKLGFWPNIYRNMDWRDESMKPMKKLEIESSLDKLDGCFSMIVGPKIGDIGFDNDNLGDNSAAWLGRGSSDLHILKGVCFKQSMIPAIYTVISHGILTYFDPWMLG